MTLLPHGFRIPTARDRNLILSYTLPISDGLSCEYCFANLLSWGELYQLSFKEENGRLWIYNGQEDFLYFPLGAEVTPKILIEASEQFRSYGLGGVLDQIPLAWEERYREELKGFSFRYKDDFWDYVYASEKLAELPGECLSKKRNLLKQFESRYPDWRIEPLNGHSITWISDFVRRWAESAGRDGGSVEEDLEALKQVFKLWDDGGFEGLAVWIADEPVAFSVWSCPTADMAVIHFEKALRDFKGGSQIINRETARYLRPRIRWINREQDLGVPGLRQAKRSYDPDFMIEVGILTPIV